MSLKIDYETSLGPNTCVSLRGENVSELVFCAWLKDRLASWSSKWKVQQWGSYAKLVNGQWVAMVDIAATSSEAPLERLLNM